MNVNRREALKIGALGALGVAGLSLPFGGSVAASSISTLAAKDFPVPFSRPFIRPTVLPYVTKQDAQGSYRLYTVEERKSTARILPNVDTPVYAYNGSVPGPIVSVPQGTRVKLRVRNQLPAMNPLSGEAFNTSTHLHGSASLPQYDGYANDVTKRGEYKDYLYPNWQPARTLWYHDHNVMTTAQNAYSGLAAQYHLHDPWETENLPQGDYDVPMTITDAMFKADGSLGYNDNSHSGLWGDVILINGVPWPVMDVKPKIYRFRMLNASISRSYRFKLSNGAPLHMVATDGGIMPQTQTVTEYRHAGAERYEFLIDFRPFAGQTIDLLNSSNPNNVNYDNTGKVMRFKVAATEQDLPADRSGSRTRTTIPTTLVPSEAMALKPAQATNRTSLRFERTDGHFTINGKTWLDIENSNFQTVMTNPKPDEVGLWTLENRSGGWFHPVHIHLVDFQVVSRNGAEPHPWERGPKDVVYIGEGETVQLLMKFTLNKGGGTTGGNKGGRYMMHCHNLPHEDHDMMSQFAVGDVNENDPIASARPKVDTGTYPD